MEAPARRLTPAPGTKAGARFKGSGTALASALVGVVEGVALSPWRIETTKGTLFLLYHHNARLGTELRVVKKPSPPHFPTFERYAHYLGTVCSAVANNAAHSSRDSSYSLLATVSTGYDSPACAAIARAAGCERGTPPTLESIP